MRPRASLGVVPSFKDEPTTEPATLSPCLMVYCKRCKCYFVRERCVHAEDMKANVEIVNLEAPSRGHAGYTHAR
jgi:hypothetical protein